MPRPRHPRPDANQQDIISALVLCGFMVADVSAILPTPDLFVLDPTQPELGWTAWELKVPGADLTPAEQRAVDLGAVQVTYDAEKVLAYYGRIKENDRCKQ